MKTFKYAGLVVENPDGLLDQDFMDAASFIRILQARHSVDHETLYILKLRVQQRRLTRLELEQLRKRAKPKMLR